MYSTCPSCHRHLGTNEELAAFPVGARLAYDPDRGRLWVVCTSCGRWNLSPLEERWEAIEEAERLFERTHLVAATENVALAQLPSGLELIRVGRAGRSEVAAWRYGRRLPAARRAGASAIAATGGLVRGLADGAAALVGRAIPALRLGYAASTWVRIHRHPDRVLALVPAAGGERAVIRYRHLESAVLLRPDRMAPWGVAVRHETGPILLTGEPGLRVAGKLLAAINGQGASLLDVRAALQRLDDAGDPQGYFARISRLTLRTSWGREPDADRSLPTVHGSASASERLALHLTSRSFWARGGTGSEPITELPRLPFVDRLALEMAAHEDTERLALQGELADLERAWREAEEIAAIADSLFDERRAAPPGWAARLFPRLAAGPATAGATVR